MKVFEEEGVGFGEGEEKLSGEGGSPHVFPSLPPAPLTSLFKDF